MKEAEFFEKIKISPGKPKQALAGDIKSKKAGDVRCLACRHNCMISDGETGICGVRMNKKGKLYLLVYGYPSAVHLDPMEKKPLYHFLPGQKVFSLGTVGCNLSCKFCQNFDLSQSTKILKTTYKNPLERRKNLIKLCEGKLDFSMGEFREANAMDDEEFPPKKVVKICEDGGIPAIAYTYNEPTIFFEYARDIGILAHEKGIKNIFVTSGYESDEVLKASEGWMDAMNIDLKMFKEDKYLEICGIKLSGVLKTIEKVAASKIWLEITTLVIPELNDSDEELRGIAKFIAGLSKDIPWHVSAFHPCYKMMDRPETPAETLMRAWEIGKNAGLKYVYTGNIFEGHHNTECPKCGKVVVERCGMGCNRCLVEAAGKGYCPECGEEIEGIWR